ncbi:MAG: HEAT repeat domain-containing protein [Bryobacteraceae bacterium]
MNCEKVREHFADDLAGTLEAAAAADFRSHLLECRACREEANHMRTTWTSLDSIPEPDPGPEMRTRFYQMLDAYQQGRREAAAPRAWWSWWPQQPALQFAFSLGLLCAGLVGGHLVTAREHANPEISQLRGEIHNMRQLVTLSLLQQQSASDRLQGVTWSYRAEQSDTEVLSALLHTINRDQSVNVRLAAVDALRNFGDSPVARKGLVQSLSKQTSPMVQIAIIDLLVELKERPAASALRFLLGTSGLDENVKKRIEQALLQLG